MKDYVLFVGPNSHQTKFPRAKSYSEYSVITAEDIDAVCRDNPKATTVIVDCEDLDDNLHAILTAVEDAELNKDMKVELYFPYETADSKRPEFFKNQGVTVYTGEDVTDPAVTQTEDHSDSLLDLPTDKKIRKIVFAGTTLRIGTTTQVIQSAQFFKYFFNEVGDNRKVAVIEVNDSPLTQAYARDKKLDSYIHMNIQGLDFFSSTVDKDQLITYDVLLYDAGCLYRKDFPKKLFTHSEKQIVVFGNWYGEGHQIVNMLNSKTVTYIGSFIPESHRDSLRRNNMFFAPYQPDPFDLMDEDKEMYATILKK